MTTHFMNHQQAMEQHATERYLLREMSAEERHAFEEHYLDCAECLEAVTFGTEFLEAGRQVAQEMRQEDRNPVPAPSWRERMVPLLSGWLHPASALVFALLLCFVGLSVYQMVVLEKQKNTIAQLKAPKQELRFVLREQTRSADNIQVVRVPRESQLQLVVEFTPDSKFNAYGAEIVADSKVISSFQSETTATPMTVSIPAQALAPGRYTVVIMGFGKDGAKGETGNGIFELQFTD